MTGRLLASLVVLVFCVTSVKCVRAANVTINPPPAGGTTIPNQEVVFPAHAIAPVLNVIAGGGGTVTGNGGAMGGNIKWGAPAPASGAQITFTGVSALPGGNATRAYTVARFDGIYTPAGSGGAPVTYDYQVGGWEVTAWVMATAGVCTNRTGTLANFNAIGQYRPFENTQGPFGRSAGFLRVVITRDDTSAQLANAFALLYYPAWYYGAANVGANGSSLRGAAYTVTIQYNLLTPLRSKTATATDQAGGVIP